MLGSYSILEAKSLGLLLLPLGIRYAGALGVGPVLESYSILEAESFGLLLLLLPWLHLAGPLGVRRLAGA